MNGTTDVTPSSFDCLLCFQLTRILDMYLAQFLHSLLSCLSAEMPIHRLFGSHHIVFLILITIATYDFEVIKLTAQQMEFK